MRVLCCVKVTLVFVCNRKQYRKSDLHDSVK